MLPALFPYKLLPYGFRRKYRPQRVIPKQKGLKSKYDVVIIGGGGHALACAYYLARDHGITDVCILEKGYLAGGNTARNTAIIRSNYLTPEGVRFYEQSLKLYRDLSQDFDFNILYSERGHFTLAHTDAAVRTSRWRAEVNKQLGVDSELIFPDEIHRLCPHLNMSDHVRYPIRARSIIRPDRSRATTRSPGATPAARPRSARRCISRRPSAASSSRTAR
jgi:sarcosine oxidase, subunit beta